MRFTFEELGLDVAARELTAGGEAVAVEPQVFDVLCYLVEHHDRMVTKTELLDNVWGDRFVSESALTSRIKSARRAIGDNGRDQRLIRTVHGRGFRFIGDVTELADTAADPGAATPAVDTTGEETSGVRTLLFTDIESSTALWERHGDDMNTALARHDEMTTAVVEAAGGRVFKHTGDGFAAEFARSDDAIAAAIALQSRIQAADWSPLPTLRVRMALHRGEVNFRGGDVFGVTVSSAAKLLGVANGGQIVASDAVAHQVAGGPAAALLSDVGAFDVTGLGEHVILHLVESPDIDVDDRPLRADTGARTNLPRRRRDLVGRGGDLTDVLELLGRSHLVSIVGPGGAGKTTLAIEAARRSMGRYPGGVWLVELAAVEADHVAAAALAAVDGTAGGMVSVDHIVDRLGPAPVLLVIDNCEHVIDASAKLVDELLQHHDSLSVLATSREVLDVRGEAVRRVEGLGYGSVTDEAVELFIRRAGDAGHLTGDLAEREVARQIVERLDGLPLAIELAVPRLASASVAELHATLDDQLSVLASRRRHVDRQSTMAQAIGWSFDLLTDNEQQLLTEMSVFSSPFRLAAAEAVSSAVGVADTVHRLVEQSMVSHVATAQGSRFRLLEPIRQYVERDLDEDQRHALARRHAEHFAERVTHLARQMRTAEEPEAAANLNTEWPDVTKAVRWGLRHGRPDVAVEPLVTLDDHLLYQLRVEAYGWLEEAAETFDDLGPLRPAVDLLRGYGAWSASDIVRAARLHDEAMADMAPTPTSIFLEFCIAMTEEDFEEVCHLGHRLWATATELGDESWSMTAAAYRLVGQTMADPSSDLIDELAAEVDRRLEESEWPTGRCAGLLAHTTRCMRTGDYEQMEQVRNELLRVTHECRAPWFALTAGGQAGSVASSGSNDQLKAAARSLRNAVISDDAVQLPAIFRSAVTGLAGIGHFDVAALLIGRIPHLHGIGESGAMTPGYDEAVEVVRGALNDEFDRLTARGRQLDLPALADAVDAVADRLDEAD